MSRRVIVVGGGVAGLTVAYRLAAAADPPDALVLESSDRVGGKLGTVRVGDLELEAGADSFVARKPWAVELVRELGLGSELVAPASAGAYLWTTHGLVRYSVDGAFGIPGDVGTAFRWPGLSRAGRMRALQDLVRRPRRQTSDEALGSLLRRRVGDEATDRSVGPLLAGLFAGDVDRLSVLATFPELAAWERDQGSLIRGAQAARRDAAAVASSDVPMFLKLRGGSARLTDALTDAVGPGRVLTGARVSEVRAAEGRWAVRSEDGSVREADVVVFATPAFDAAAALRAVARSVVDELEGIAYASTAVVFGIYADGTASGLPEGTGFVVPREQAPMTATTWLSNKWPDPAFGTRAVVRSYVGGVGSEEVVDAPDDDLVRACSRHLAAVVDLPDHPSASRVVRWHRSMPQYEVGHLERVARIRSGLPDGIFVTGSAYGGVGIPDSVRDAADTAAAVRDHLASPTRQETLR